MLSKQANFPLINMKHDFNSQIITIERCNSQSNYKSNTKEWSKKMNCKRSSVAYPFIPKIKHKSIKELECSESINKWTPLNYDIHKLFKSTPKIPLKGLKGKKILQNFKNYDKQNYESDSKIEEQQDSSIQNQIREIRLECKYKNRNNEVKYKNELHNKIEHCCGDNKINEQSCSQKSNIELSSSSIHFQKRNLYINNKQNKIEELIRKQSLEGSYLDKFSDATRKYLKLNIVNYTRNNDLNSPTNTNTYSSLDNIGTADSCLNSRNHLKENLQSKDWLLIEDQDDNIEVDNKYIPRKKDLECSINSPRYYLHNSKSNLSTSNNRNILNRLMSNKSLKTHGNNLIQHPTRITKQFTQRSTMTGERVSTPKSTFMPSDIYFYPKLSKGNYKMNKKWISSKKPLCICKMKI